MHVSICYNTIAKNIYSDVFVIQFCNNCSVYISNTSSKIKKGVDLSSFLSQSMVQSWILKHDIGFGNFKTMGLNPFFE